MGWQIEMDDTGHISGLLNQSKEAWRPSDAVTWADFKDEIERTRTKIIWAKASAHRGGENMELGVDLTVAQRHYTGLVKAGRPREAGALMTICTGACWSPARLAEEGIVQPEEAKCPSVVN